MKYKDFSDQFLVAAYRESRLKPGETIRSGDIIDRYPLIFEEGWVVELVRDLGVRGYFISKGVDAGDRGQPIRLTGRGLRVAEDLMEAGVGTFRLDLGDGVGFPPATPVENDEVSSALDGVADAPFLLEGAEAVPASDRIVRVDHNSVAVKEIREAASDLVRHIRRGNDLGDLTMEEADAAANEVYQLGRFFEADTLRPSIVMAFASPSLRWIADKAGGAIVGAAAFGLLALIEAFFGEFVF